MPEALEPDTYDRNYYEQYTGRPYRRDEYWLGFFQAIADRITETIRPARVLDAGCALGMLVEALRSRGVEAYGIDVSSYAIANVHDSIRPFCREASVTRELEGRYDLIVSIEVLEHVPAREGEDAIANICRHTDDVLFSSTPSDFREDTHVNVQPAEYWAEQFARHGLVRDVDYDASFITPWAVRFRRRGDPLPRIVRQYERWNTSLATERGELRQLVAELKRDVANAKADAEVARQTIANMERSFFWRMRTWLGRK